MAGNNTANRTVKKIQINSSDILLYVFFGLYGIFAASFEPFTWPIRIATFAPVLVFLILAWRLRWFSADYRPPRNIRQSRRAGITIWLLILGLITLFQLYNYIGQPRAVYPTISSLFEIVFQFYPLRALTFSLWLGLGWYFLKR